MRLVAIRQAHRLAGHELRADHPAIRDVLQGIRRTHGTAPAKKEAAVTEIVRDAVRELAKAGHGLRSLRDRALLLVGFAAALRRSELVALDAADLAFTRDGLVLTLRRRKTDQEGQGTEIGVPFGAAAPTCPVRALQAWLDGGRHRGGAGLRVRHPAAAGPPAGGCPTATWRGRCRRRSPPPATTPARFGGHSLRAGFATAAARAGVPESADHGPDRPPLAAGAARLHPPRQPVRRQRRRQIGL